MRILGRRWMRAIFTKSRLNVFLFIWLVLAFCLFMAASAACIFLIVRHWWLPTHQVQLPVDFVPRVIKSTVTPPKQELIAIVNLEDVISLVPMDYSIDVELAMPRSKINRDMGNFILRGVLSSMPYSEHVDQQILASRSQDKVDKMCLFPFQSTIVRVIDTIVYAPLYLLGLKEESSTLSIRLWETAKNPLKEHPYLLVHLDKQVSVARAKLIFTVRLRGISYLLHTYPISTFILGSTFICEVEFLCAALALLCYGLNSKTKQGQKESDIAYKNQSWDRGPYTLRVNSDEVGKENRKVPADQDTSPPWTITSDEEEQDAVTSTLFSRESEGNDHPLPSPAPSP